VTIDEAIEVLTLWKRQNCPPPLFDEFHALQLGIEALLVLSGRPFDYDNKKPFRLPGETEK